MKSDLSNVKVGDTIWTIQEGWTKVEKINKKDFYPIDTKNGRYTFDGIFFINDKFPSAFLECPFVEVKEYEVIWDNNKQTEKRIGIPYNGKFYVESGWTKWKEVEQKVTLEIPLSELENNPELKKYLKQ